MGAKERREHLERAVAEGGTIMTARGAITRQVPSSSTLARTPLERRAAREDLERRFRQLQEEGRALEGFDNEAGELDRGDELPDDFPGRKALAAAGINKRSDVAVFSLEELTAIKGIGETTAAQILEALSK